MEQQGIGGLIFPIALFAVIFFFLIYRPQKKKQQAHEKMVSSISRGDTVITAGGFFGKVVTVLDDSYVIELADGVKVRILKSSISIRKEPGEAGGSIPRPKKKRRRRPIEGEPEGLEQTNDSDADSDAADTEAYSEETDTEVDAAGAQGVTVEENEALAEETIDTTAEESDSEENK